MLSCCRVILAQIEKIRDARNRLQKVMSPQEDKKSNETKAQAAINALDHLRDVLGTYAINTDLTFLFRQQIEPDLANVWTLADLDDYCHRLQIFSKRVDDALGRWRVKYCKDEEEALNGSR